MPETQHPPRETPISGHDYLAVQANPEFQELRSRLRRFVFPMSALFLIWYFAYVLLGAFAHDFMAIKVWGNINVGLLIGLAGGLVATMPSEKDFDIPDTGLLLRKYLKGREGVSVCSLEDMDRLFDGIPLAAAGGTANLRAIVSENAAKDHEQRSDRPRQPRFRPCTDR